MSIPHQSYFLIDLEDIINEIEEAKTSNVHSISEDYFAYNLANCLLAFIDLEKNNDIWSPKMNFLDYSNEENDLKTRRLYSLWNSGNPIKTLPPILEWIQEKQYFTIVDGFHRARIFSNAFAGDDAEGEMIFLFKKENYNELPEQIKRRINLIA